MVLIARAGEHREQRVADPERGGAPRFLPVRFGKCEAELSGDASADVEACAKSYRRPVIHQDASTNGRALDAAPVHSRSTTTGR
jgi:hypothetical protein